MKHWAARQGELQERRRAADAKEVGVGNPAEETYCCPNRPTLWRPPPARQLDKHHWWHGWAHLDTATIGRDAPVCSAGFQTRCVADFQVGRAPAIAPPAGLESRDTVPIRNREKSALRWQCQDALLCRRKRPRWRVPRRDWPALARTAETCWNARQHGLQTREEDFAVSPPEEGG